VIPPVPGNYRYCDIHDGESSHPSSSRLVQVLLPLPFVGDDHERRYFEPIHGIPRQVEVGDHGDYDGDHDDAYVWIVVV